MVTAIKSQVPYKPVRHIAPGNADGREVGVVFGQETHTGIGYKVALIFAANVDCGEFFAVCRNVVYYSIRNEFRGSDIQ